MLEKRFEIKQEKQKLDQSNKLNKLDQSNQRKVNKGKVHNFGRGWDKWGLMSFAIIISVFLLFSTPLFSDLGWWNLSWPYRQQINISNTAGDLTNYQVRLDLNSSNVGSNFNWSNNGSDIRFTNSTDDLLNFWIEYWNVTEQEATIWVNVTSLPNNTNTTIYMYYGNQAASSASDGDATFDFFADFEQCNIGDDSTCEGFTEESGNWTVVSEKALHENTDGDDFTKKTLSTHNYWIHADLKNAEEPIQAIGMYVGGSNYPMISVGNYKDTCKGWYEGELKPVIGFYHLEQQTVREQLQTMYNNGQRRIALFIWHKNFSDSEISEYGSVYGHIVSSNGGNLVPQQQENLRNLIIDIKNTGFEEIIVRFAPRVPNLPESWSTWNEDLYQQNLNFIVLLFSNHSLMSSFVPISTPFGILE